MARSQDMISAQREAQIREYSWAQKWRPVTLDEIILPEHVLTPIIKMVREDKKIPHLLFTSVLPGSGKSTLAQVICNELGADVVKVNASKDNGIDVIRNKISPFAMRQSIYEDSPKIVFLDEFDGTTQNFQDAFRVPMEEYSDNVSFIMTANYKEKISLPIQDRCELFDFNLSNAAVKKEILVKIVKRMKFILEQENVDFDLDVLMKYCNKAYPRIRHIITDIQKYVKGNGMILDDGIMDFNSVGDEFYTMIINKNFTAAKDYVLKNSLNIDTLYTELYRNLCPKLLNDKGVYANSIITINRYAVQNGQVIDKELNFVALLLELISLF